MIHKAVIGAVLGLALFSLGQYVHAAGGSITLQASCQVKVMDSVQTGNRSITYTHLSCGIINMTGSEFMHEVSLFGPVWTESSKSASRLLGHTVIADKDKDEIYMSIERRGVAPDPGTGRWTITGGNGKYVGISGSGTYDVTYLPSVHKGLLLNISVLKGTYQIP
jgi:hypothetical protein